MLYYLLFNSSYIPEGENKIIKSVIVGTIMYIFIHALLVSGTNLNKYFWLIVSIDMGTIYILNNSLLDTKNNEKINNSSNKKIKEHERATELEEEEENQETYDDDLLIEQILNSNNPSEQMQNQTSNDYIDYSDFERNL